jgi:hypothetical protein
VVETIDICHTIADPSGDGDADGTSNAIEHASGSDPP